MKIATWNVERLKHYDKKDIILRCCEECNADILVLTENDQRLTPNYLYHYDSEPPSDTEIIYASTERRVSIFSRYPCIRRHKTYDNKKAVCIELETERGDLLVYGTVIGIFGNRHSTYKEDLEKQINDIYRLSGSGDGICVCGDFNCSFSDNYYFTKNGRTLLREAFSQNRITLVTACVPQCIDHIAISDNFVNSDNVKITEWNLDKRLSDHKGISVIF